MIRGRTKISGPAISIDAALQDHNLLGAALGDATTWQTWLVALKAAYGQPLNPDERKTFNSIAGSRSPPTGPVRELWCIVGRRGGKSRAAAMIASHAAALQKHHRAPGEVGYVLTLSPTVAQAGVVFSYAKSFLQESPILRQQVESTTRTEIRLRDNITIATHPASFRSTRGRTMLTCILDEVAYFRSEDSAEPDLEIYRSLLPALETTRGMLVGISTGYRKSGLLHQKHKDFFGVDDPDVLVVSGPSILFNPTLSQASIDKAAADDPEAAASEWMGGFRSDIAAFLAEDDILACVDYERPSELAPQPGLGYRAFIDPSGGRADSMTLAIGHSERNCAVLDCVRDRIPPFDPASVVQEFAALVKSYGLSAVTGDSYSGEWCASAFREHGITYNKSELPKSRIYLEGQVLFTRRAVKLPNHPRLLKELRLLERRTHSGGRDTIDHPPGAHDDLANACFGALYRSQQPTQRMRVGTVHVGYGAAPPPRNLTPPERSNRISWVVVDEDGNELSRTKSWEKETGAWRQQNPRA